VLSIAAMAFLASIARAQSQPHNAPVLEKLCGKLLHSEQVPLKNTTNTFEDRTKNLSHGMVQLYRADDDRPCCNGLFLAAETKTGRWGSFQLKEKGLAPGLYWVVVDQTRGNTECWFVTNPKALPNNYVRSPFLN
jgi:hypothetical protein